MENIGASVSAVLTQEKKEAEKKTAEKEGAKYIRKENEVIFCLREDCKYQISVVAVWSENASGDVMDQLCIYYRHILTGKLCMGIWACRVGVRYDEWSEEKWDTLTGRIMYLRPQDLRQIVCHEKKYAIHPL